MTRLFAADALKGRTAFVTGGSRNLGRAICVALGAAGANVAVAAHSAVAEAEETAEMIRALGARAVALTGDIADRAQPARLIAAAAEALGPIDILINNAAPRPRRAFLDMTRAEWDAIMDTVLNSAFDLTQLVLPGMIERQFGRVLFLSGPGPRPSGGAADRAHVMAAKAGMVGLMRALAVEFGDAGVTFNAVGPGLMDTTRDPVAYPHWPIPQAEIAKQVAVPRLGLPQEVADACVYLASDAAGYVTGQTLHVNGGYMIPS